MGVHVAAPVCCHVVTSLLLLLLMLLLTLFLLLLLLLLLLPPCSYNALFKAGSVRCTINGLNLPAGAAAAVSVPLHPKDPSMGNKVCV